MAKTRSGSWTYPSLPVHVTCTLSILVISVYTRKNTCGYRQDTDSSYSVNKQWGTEARCIPNLFRYLIFIQCLLHSLKVYSNENVYTQYKVLFILMGLFLPPINVKIDYQYWIRKPSKDSLLFTDLCSPSSRGSCQLPVPAAHIVLLCWQLSLLVMTNLWRALWLLQDRPCFHWTPVWPCSLTRQARRVSTALSAAPRWYFQLPRYSVDQVVTGFSGGDQTKTLHWHAALGEVRKRQPLR